MVGHDSFSLASMFGSLSGEGGSSWGGVEYGDCDSLMERKREQNLKRERHYVLSQILNKFWG